MTDHARQLASILRQLRANPPDYYIPGEGMIEYEPCGVAQRASGKETTKLWHAADDALAAHDQEAQHLASKKDPHAVPMHVLDTFITSAMKELGHGTFLLLPEQRLGLMKSIMIDLVDLVAAVKQTQQERDELLQQLPKGLVEVIREYQAMFEQRQSQHGDGFNAAELAAHIMNASVTAPKAPPGPKPALGSHASGPLTDTDWDQLDMAARGATSGIENWPWLRAAIQKVMSIKGYISTLPACPKSAYAFVNTLLGQARGMAAAHEREHMVQEFDAARALLVPLMPALPTPTDADINALPVPPPCVIGSHANTLGKPGSRISCPNCRCNHAYEDHTCIACGAELHPAPTIRHYLCLNSSCRHDNMLKRVVVPEDRCTKCGQPLDGEVRIKIGLDKDPNSTECQAWHVLIEIGPNTHTTRVDAVDHHSALELARTKHGISTDGIRNAKRILVEPMK